MRRVQKRLILDCPAKICREIVWNPTDEVFFWCVGVDSEVVCQYFRISHKGQDVSRRC